MLVEVSGEDVYGTLKKSGVHRVQRVPDTETQGRVHTSAATVAVMPEAEEVDFELNPADVKWKPHEAVAPAAKREQSRNKGDVDAHSNRHRGGLPD